MFLTLHANKFTKKIITEFRALFVNGALAIMSFYKFFI